MRPEGQGCKVRAVMRGRKVTQTVKSSVLRDRFSSHPMGGEGRHSSCASITEKYSGSGGPNVAASAWRSSCNERDFSATGMSPRWSKGPSGGKSFGRGRSNPAHEH